MRLVDIEHRDHDVDLRMRVSAAQRDARAGRRTTSAAHCCGEPGQRSRDRCRGAGRMARYRYFSCRRTYTYDYELTSQAGLWSQAGQPVSRQAACQVVSDLSLLIYC